MKTRFVYSPAEICYLKLFIENAYLITTVYERRIIEFAVDKFANVVIISGYNGGEKIFDIAVSRSDYAEIDKIRKSL